MSGPRIHIGEGLPPQDYRIWLEGCCDTQVILVIAQGDRRQNVLAFNVLKGALEVGAVPVVLERNPGLQLDDDGCLIVRTVANDRAARRVLQGASE